MTAAKKIRRYKKITYIWFSATATGLAIFRKKERAPSDPGCAHVLRSSLCHGLGGGFTSVFDGNGSFFPALFGIFYRDLGALL